MNHHARFEIDRTILTSLNERKELTVTDGQTDPNHRKASLLRILFNRLIRINQKLVEIKVSNIFLSIF